MGEQEVQTLENQSPDNTGNDGASSSAIEALGGEEPNTSATDSVQDEGTQDPLEEQRERSRLGRRFTKFEQEIDGLKQTINQLSSTLMQRPDPYTQRAVDFVEDKPPVDYITTPEDLDKYEAWKQAKMEKQRNTYANQYVHSIKSMSYLNPDMHSIIENELLTNVNEYPTYSKFVDPVSDARQNYLKAENKILKSKLGGNQPKPNVKGGTNEATGVSLNTRVNTPPKASIKLDDYASKFVRSLGESEDAEWVQKSLRGSDGT